MSLIQISKTKMINSDRIDSVEFRDKEEEDGKEFVITVNGIGHVVELDHSMTLHQLIKETKDSIRESLRALVKTSQFFAG